jgi:hypothetical protein
MSQIVKCDICGRVYNQSYLNSHKRLSHSNGGTAVPSAESEPETLERIVSMYGQLSESRKKEVRIRLSNWSGRVR